MNYKAKKKNIMMKTHEHLYRRCADCIRFAVYKKGCCLHNPHMLDGENEIKSLEEKTTSICQREYRRASRYLNELREEFDQGDVESLIHYINGRDYRVFRSRDVLKEHVKHLKKNSKKENAVIEFISKIQEEVDVLASRRECLTEKLTDIRQTLEDARVQHKKRAERWEYVADVAHVVAQRHALNVIIRFMMKPDGLFEKILSKRHRAYFKKS